MKVEREIISADLPGGRFGKESRENVWVDAESILGSAVMPGGEECGVGDSPKAQHLQQYRVSCAPGC